jgi:hypothetical protein
MPIGPNSAYTNRVSLVFLPETRGKLQALADDGKLKESEVVRQLIEAAYVARFGKKKPPAVRPKYNSAEARARKKYETKKPRRRANVPGRGSNI